MRLLLLSLMIVTLAIPQGSTQEKPPAQGVPKTADKLTINARVEQVYSSEKQKDTFQTDKVYAMEVKVTKDSSMNGTLVGQTVFVKTWQASKRPANWNGPKGQNEIPGRGDLVEIQMAGGQGIFEAVVPEGIRIEALGSFKSNAIGLEMILLEPAEFSMGSPANEPNRRPDEAQHKVKLGRPFYMGIHEVTQEEYEKVMQVNPSAFSKNGTSKDRVGGVDTKRFPVEKVSWFDAVIFCNRLSEKDGYEPYYRISEIRKEGDAIKTASVAINGGKGYRLPTEAEWEYGCRGSTSSSFHYGKESSASTANVKSPIIAGGYGNFPKWKEIGRTTTVGSFPPNAFGLYDMHGNVAEWCGDWYDKDYYGKSPAEDPRGPEKGTHKSIRGGSWMVNDPSCRSASRHFLVPNEQVYYGGFRVARNP